MNKVLLMKATLHRLECLNPYTPGIELRNVYIYILLYTGYIYMIYLYINMINVHFCVYMMS